MNKISVLISNLFCPQTMFLYGTYKDDGTPNFGLFCWFSYIWDGEMGVMACIGGEKLTKDRINAAGVFSANLVTESMLPLADYFGNVEGYSPDKMKVPVEVTRGQVLDVPILDCSPVAFELEVFRTISLVDGEVYLCKIRNVLQSEEIADESRSVEERINAIAPVRTTCMTYFSWDGKAIGSWGEPMKEVGK